MVSGKTQRIIDRVTAEDIKVVSFDIFDTLLVRPAMEPTDFFDIVAVRLGVSGFKELRVAAEEYARKHRQSGCDDVTIDEIYVSMGNLWSFTNEELSLFKKTEIDIEYQYLYPRKIVYHMYKEALNAGKEIIAISDMYLPRAYLRRVLEKNGYNDIAIVYVSSEDGGTKHTGRLYELVLSECLSQGVSARQIIHVGDSYFADYANAKRCGLRAAYLPSPAGMFSKHKAYAGIADNSYFRGYLANALFDDPFVRYPKGAAMAKPERKSTGDPIGGFAIGTEYAFAQKRSIQSIASECQREFASVFIDDLDKLRTVQDDSDLKNSNTNLKDCAYAFFDKLGILPQAKSAYRRIVSTNKKKDQ